MDRKVFLASKMYVKQWSESWGIMATAQVSVSNHEHFLEKLNKCKEALYNVLTDKIIKIN